ncbi:hypothetical protein AX16_008481 [Volvariella volvacea WC 439]|nr:hypothetical protein AX16_008481 [Volvariella volvacea WC 439]
MHFLPHLSAFLLVLPFASAAKNPKRGLAFAEPDTPFDIVRANQSNSVISWIYNWAQTPPDYIARSGIPFIPMQWGAGGAENFASAVRAQGARTVLGFNEPDFADQANISPTYAAQLWRQYIEPLKAQGVRLGAPAITNAPWGRPWLADFLAACTGCSIDFIPFHWYGEGIGSFYDYIWQMHGQFPNWPLWVTEFASTSQDDAGTPLAYDRHLLCLRIFRAR